MKIFIREKEEYVSLDEMKEKIEALSADEISELADEILFELYCLEMEDYGSKHDYAVKRELEKEYEFFANERIRRYFASKAK